MADKDSGKKWIFWDSARFPPPRDRRFAPLREGAYFPLGLLVMSAVICLFCCGQGAFYLDDPTDSTQYICPFCYRPDWGASGLVDAEDKFWYERLLYRVLTGMIRHEDPWRRGAPAPLPSCVVGTYSQRIAAGKSIDRVNTMIRDYNRQHPNRRDVAFFLPPVVPAGVLLSRSFEESGRLRRFRDEREEIRRMQENIERDRQQLRQQANELQSRRDKFDTTVAYYDESNERLQAEKRSLQTNLDALNFGVERNRQFQERLIERQQQLEDQQRDRVDETSRIRETMRESLRDELRTEVRAEFGEEFRANLRAEVTRSVSEAWRVREDELNQRISEFERRENNLALEQGRWQDEQIARLRVQIRQEVWQELGQEIWQELPSLPVPVPCPGGDMSRSSSPTSRSSSPASSVSSFCTASSASSCPPRDTVSPAPSNASDVTLVAPQLADPGMITSTSSMTATNRSVTWREERSVQLPPQLQFVQSSRGRGRGYLQMPVPKNYTPSPLVRAQPPRVTSYAELAEEVASTRADSRVSEAFAGARPKVPAVGRGFRGALASGRSSPTRLRSYSSRPRSEEEAMRFRQQGRVNNQCRKQQLQDSLRERMQEVKAADHRPADLARATAVDPTDVVDPEHQRLWGALSSLSLHSSDQSGAAAAEDVLRQPPPAPVVLPQPGMEVVKRVSPPGNVDDGSDSSSLDGSSSSSDESFKD